MQFLQDDEMMSKERLQNVSGKFSVKFVMFSKTDGVMC